MSKPVPPSAFGRKASAANPFDGAAESFVSREVQADNVRLRRAVASHVLRRGASELAADGDFDSFRD